ncbi:MAG: hypothetical protein II718_02445, partial [Clostridiales bacterium]|nr:hypothetical protein [Clostridiales bacterium]
GATLQITNAAGYNIDLSGVTVTQNGSPAKDVSITSSSVTFTTVAGFSAIIHDMPVGRYVLTELAAPEGYLVAESITFYIDDEGDLYVAGTPDELVGEVWMKDKTDPNVTTTTTTEESEGTTTETTPPTESTTTTSDSSETTETTKPTDTDDANKKKTDETTETTAAGDTAVASTGEKALSTTLLLAIVMLSASAFVYLIRFGYIKEEEKDEK